MNKALKRRPLYITQICFPPPRRQYLGLAFHQATRDYRGGRRHHHWFPDEPVPLGCLGSALSRAQWSETVPRKPCLVYGSRVRALRLIPPSTQTDIRDGTQAFSQLSRFRPFPLLVIIDMSVVAKNGFYIGHFSLPTIRLSPD